MQTSYRKQHIGVSANDLVNLPYQWCSNFHRVFCDAISQKHQCIPVSSVSVPIAHNRSVANAQTCGSRLPSGTWFRGCCTVVDLELSQSTSTIAADRM